MRRLFISAILLSSLLLAVSAPAATGKVIKVLPHFLDAKGRHTTSPSLFDRDAYQAWLREHPAERSGIRYDVQWRVRAAKGPLKLRVELRGVAQGHVAKQKTLEQELKSGHWPSVTWTGVALMGEDYKNFGEITAWRVTLWDGDQLLDEQKSFLW